MPHIAEGVQRLFGLTSALRPRGVHSLVQSRIGGEVRNPAGNGAKCMRKQVSVRYVDALRGCLVHPQIVQLDCPLGHLGFGQYVSCPLNEVRPLR